MARFSFLYYRILNVSSDFVATKAPSGRELLTKSGEGECVNYNNSKLERSALSFRHAFACHLPPQGGIKSAPSQGNINADGDKIFKILF